MVVKIVSGWSNPGGSTLHHIALTNLLNGSGKPCVFYGPHEWHLGKCKSALLPSLKIDVGDILITHFIQLPILEMQKAAIHILSCHETDLFPIRELLTLPYNYIQYVSNSQKAWHDVAHPNVVIPPVVEKIKWCAPNKKRAGVLGSVDAHKQTHLSVTRALEAGYEEVYIIGSKTDRHYYAQVIFPLLSEKVSMLEHMDDKEKMYNKVDAVFHSSERETFNLIEAECKVNGIPYFGLSSAETDGEILEKKEILERWQLILKL